MTTTHFFGSQIGGPSVINYSYTDLPWTLFFYDIYYFFSYFRFLPYILWPVKPAGNNSGSLDELSPTWENLFCIAVHFFLVIYQLVFICALPFSVLFPIPVVLGAVVVGLGFNYLVCETCLNGRETEYHSEERYAERNGEHEHEMWVFINGVAVGKHWMISNLNRLAMTFKRPILGIHNKTNGILFDVIECLVQRNMGYATYDVRVCYSILKEKLYNPEYSKVVFILHSQGGIEGSLIIDWLLQELPQDLLAKLEVYTFGNAANHFNNPHRHLGGQTRALRNGLLGQTDSTRAAEGAPDGREERVPTGLALQTETSSSAPAELSDRAIGHIEHYAHTTDFVALWGVLHFATSKPGSLTIPRFIGRMFVRSGEGGGHQFCQHYLDGMFPLAKDDKGNGIGCVEEGNEFMESEVLVGGDGGEREGMAVGDGVEVQQVGTPTEVGRARRRRGGGAAVPGVRRTETGVKMKVRELSRLWKYRNGRSPDDKPPLLVRDADGVVRGATM